MSWSRYRAEWFGNVRTDLICGLLIALALIPEAISFSVVAGVDPKIGLYASFSIAVVIAFAGGRPGMISAATAAVAVLVIDLVKDYGLDYLFAATILAGIFQIFAGVLKLGRLMRFVSQPVMTGFVNALAILIFLAQIPELTDVSWQTYPMVAAGLAIIYLLPRYFTALPSPLISILVLTGASLLVGMNVNEVRDMGELPSSLPSFLIPDVPFTFETLKIIAPYSAAMMVVGLLESLMTATLIDDITDTPSDKNRECIGQGLANGVTGFLGGMGGCAMIGQSMINMRSGGRGRLSTFAAGIFLLILVVVLGDWVGRIPMPALVAIMIMVSISTFKWSSIRELRTHPKTASIVMLLTVVVVVATHNLALGVLAGVLLSGMFFAWEIAHLVRIESALDDDRAQRTYRVSGQIFFASTERFINAFDYREPVERVRIDVSHAHFWDTSAVAALDKVVIKFRQNGVNVLVAGLNDASATIVQQLAMHDRADAAEVLAGH